MTTYTERAEQLWKQYGRIVRGRVMLADEYLGRIGTDDQGQPFTFAKGERRVGYVGVAPVALTAQWLMR